MNVHQHQPPLHNMLTLSVVECKLIRILADATDIESAIGLVAELRKINPVSTPIADLRIAARALRLAALKLDQIVKNQTATERNLT